MPIIWTPDASMFGLSLLSSWHLQGVVSACALYFVISSCTKKVPSVIVCCTIGMSNLALPASEMYRLVEPALSNHDSVFSLLSNRYSLSDVAFPLNSSQPCLTSSFDMSPCLVLSEPYLANDHDANASRRNPQALRL